MTIGTPGSDVDIYAPVEAQVSIAAEIVDSPLLRGFQAIRAWLSETLSLGGKSDSTESLHG